MQEIPIWANYALAAFLAVRGWQLLETAVNRVHAIPRVTRGNFIGAVLFFLLAGYLLGYALGLWGPLVG